MIDFAHLQIPFKMPKYNVGWIIVSLCVFGNVLAIDLTRLYGHHNKRELDAIGKFPAPIYIDNYHVDPVTILGKYVNLICIYWSYG